MRYTSLAVIAALLGTSMAKVSFEDQMKNIVRLADEEPAADDTTEPAAEEETTEEPAADDTTEEPAADDTTEEPAADDTTEEPAAEDTTEEPAADETTEEPAAETEKPSGGKGWLIGGAVLLGAVGGGLLLKNRQGAQAEGGEREIFKSKIKSKNTHKKDIKVAIFDKENDI